MKEEHAHLRPNFADVSNIEKIEKMETLRSGIGVRRAVVVFLLMTGLMLM